MTPQAFIEKWSASERRERAHAQEHFIDLCRLLGEKTPGEGTQDTYTFEKGASVLGGGNGWADVWKRGCFAWEYKSGGRNLDQALVQLKRYSGTLDNPPLLIVSDMEWFRIHTNWTNTVQQVHELHLEELRDANRRQLLKHAFSELDVEQLKPGKTREELTKEVAQEFVTLAQNLRERGHDPEQVAHFINRMVFCMFAEDVDLLPDKLFKRMLEASLDDPDSFADNAQKLFAAMANKGGKVGFTPIDWFNGGVFEDDSALPLTKSDIKTALAAANRNWSNIDPSIMGTLFERGLDPGKRSQLGAHYTDPEKIMQIVNPVIVGPLNQEWAAKRTEIEKKIEQSRAARSPAARTRAFNEASSLKTEFIERLKNYRVLDPACGSGNFLYLALKELKNIEHRVNIECEQLGLARGFPVVGPECVRGLEINPFAAELARVSVWVGEIQWMREHGFDASRDPILKPLNTIECRDAILAGRSEAAWPPADVIIGNPPFLGRTYLRDGLGHEEVEKLFAAYDEQVSAEVDLVCYWVFKAWKALQEGSSVRAGLVTTNSIRGGSNRTVVTPIAEAQSIFDAWEDEPWIVEGADVRVSVICFGENASGERRLNGVLVPKINADLTSHAVNVAGASSLRTNSACSFQGAVLVGEFDIEGALARTWLSLPNNPDGSKNTDVLYPLRNGRDLTTRPRDMWVVNFRDRSEEASALYEEPFEYVSRVVKPKRLENRRQRRARLWWQHGETGGGWWNAVKNCERYIATSQVAKHRFFVWLSTKVQPHQTVIAIARDDAVTFGVLSSRHHELWTLRMCSWLGVGNDPRYTPTSCFDTFPFPEGLTPDVPATQFANEPHAKAIATAAARLNELRENWLNPADLVKCAPEVVPGYPDRLLPVDDGAAATLKKRTLTNLYNERPAWLDNAHRDLDAAVAAAYGWPADLSDDQILEHLFQLNQERAAKQ